MAEGRSPLIAVTVILVLIMGGWLGLTVTLGTTNFLWAVPTSSMAPTLMPGDLIITKAVSFHELVEEATSGGEKPVIVFWINVPGYYKGYIVHRIYKVVYEGGKAVGFQTKGDANRMVDPCIVKPEDIQGKVILRIPYIGGVLLFLKTPLGASIILTVVLILTILTLIEAASRKKVEGEFRFLYVRWESLIVLGGSAQLGPGED